VTVTPTHAPLEDTPARERRRQFSRARAWLITVAALVVVAAGLRMSGTILAPMALAAFITAVSLPPLQLMRRAGVPLPLAILVIVLVDAAILAAVAFIVFESVMELQAVAPTYLARFQGLEAQFIQRLREWGYEVSPVSYQEIFNPERLLGLATGAALRLTGIVGVTLLVLLYLIFMLAESVALPGKLRNAFGERITRAARLGDVVRDVQQYLALKTVISLATGMLVGLSAAALGVDFALFWGFLAFALNYIPSIGSFLAAVPAVLVAALQLGLGTALTLALIYATINLLLGSILDPILVGRRLRLSTLAVLLSLVFWGWAWGIIGMFLAVPLTAAVKIVMENSPALRPVAILLGPVTERRRGRTFTSEFPVPPM
jgi:AI-2 transport protein TqsA